MLHAKCKIGFVSISKSLTISLDLGSLFDSGERIFSFFLPSSIDKKVVVSKTLFACIFGRSLLWLKCSFFFFAEYVSRFRMVVTSVLYFYLGRISPY